MNYFASLGIFMRQGRRTQRQQNHCCFCLFFHAERVLGALGLNLELKARVYEAPTLSSLFLLNNYNYIVKTLQRYEYCMNAKLCLLEHKETINTSYQSCQPPQVIGGLVT